MIVLALESTPRSLTSYPICEHPVRRSRFFLQQHCISRQSKRQVAGKEGDTAKCRDAKGVVGVVQENFSVMCPPGAVWGLILFPQVYSRLILEPFFYCFHVNARKRSFGHLYISPSAACSVTTMKWGFIEINSRPPVMCFNLLLIAANGKRNRRLNLNKP